MLREDYDERKRQVVVQAIYSALKARARLEAAKMIDAEEEPLDPRKHHVCAACGRIFKSKIDLYTHKYENLWEDYHKIRHRQDRPHLCIFCGKDFLSKEDFLEHWFHEEDHENYALTFLQMGKTKKPDPEAEWLISPTEEILLERRIKHDPEMKACKRKHCAGDYISRTISFRVLANEMIIGECWGIPGSGKSHSILSLIYSHVIPESYKRLARDWLEKSDENYAAALIYRDEQRAAGRIIGTGESAHPIGIGLSAIELMHKMGVWREPRAHITFSIAETLRAIRTAQELDVIMQDEDPGLIGRGSEIAKTRIQTILKLMRKKRITFIFISPVRIQYISTSNLAFEVTHKKNPLKARITRGILYDREHVSIGWYRHKILEKDAKPFDVKEFLIAERVPRNFIVEHTDEGTADLIQSGASVILPILTIYEMLKDANLDKIQYQMGAEGVQINWGLVDEDVDKVFKGLMERGMRGEIPYKRALKALGDMPVSRIMRRVPTFGVKGEVEYQTLVAEETYERIQRKVTEQYIEDEYPDGKKVESTDDTEEEAKASLPSQFSLDDVDYIPILAQEVQQGKFKVEWKYIDAFKRYLVKEVDYKDYAVIAASMGMSSPGNISDQFKVIKGRISELRGGMFEIEILKQYLQSDLVISMEPKAVLKYPSGCSPEGMSDRKIILLDGTIRFCAWKCYGGNNATIELGRVRSGGKFLYCPEIKEARKLIEMGGDPTRIKVVMEGIMGKRKKSEDGSFVIVPEFFQVEVDPFTDSHSVTIPMRGRIPWPPTIEQLTGITPKAQEIDDSPTA